MEKIKFKVNKDKLEDLITRLSDLTDIDDSIKMKIDSEHIMIYSTLGGNILLAFKNYLLPLQEYLTPNKDLDFVLDVIIANAKKFVKNLRFIDDDKITMEISYKDSLDDDNTKDARGIMIKAGKFKIKWIAGEKYEIRDINKSILDKQLDLNNKKWSFEIKKSEFDDIKKLSSINSDKIININVSDGKVIFSETSAWELEISNTDTDINTSLILNKRFLKCINEQEIVNFHIFPNFMLVKNDDYNLMLSMEQNFSDDDL